MENIDIGSIKHIDKIILNSLTSLINMTSDTYQTELFNMLKNLIFEVDKKIVSQDLPEKQISKPEEKQTPQNLKLVKKKYLF